MIYARIHHVVDNGDQIAINLYHTDEPEENSFMQFILTNLDNGMTFDEAIDYVLNEYGNEITLLPNKRK